MNKLGLCCGVCGLCLWLERKHDKTTEKEKEKENQRSTRLCVRRNIEYGNTNQRKETGEYDRNMSENTTRRPALCHMHTGIGPLPRQVPVTKKRNIVEPKSTNNRHLARQPKAPPPSMWGCPNGRRNFPTYPHPHPHTHIQHADAGISALRTHDPPRWPVGTQ